MSLIPHHLVFEQHQTYQAFLNAWKNQRLPHSWLFWGPEGYGTDEIAMALTQVVLPDAVLLPDGHCVHPDFLTLHDVNIESVRHLKQQLSYSSFSGGRRIVFLKDLHLWNLFCINALLKAIEEPNSKILFFMTTQKPLPPTLLSRCCVQKMPLLRFPEFYHYLKSARKTIQPDAVEVTEHRALELYQKTQGRFKQAALQEDEESQIQKWFFNTLSSALKNPEILEDSALVFFKMHPQKIEEWLLIWGHEHLKNNTQSPLLFSYHFYDVMQYVQKALVMNTDIRFLLTSLLAMLSASDSKKS
jgi:DNA polymerase III delta prime subunit